jgi:hypothetical protein
MRGAIMVLMCLLAACDDEPGGADAGVVVVDAGTADHFCTTHNVFDELCGDCGAAGQFCCYDFEAIDSGVNETHPPSYCSGTNVCVSDICFETEPPKP